ncbi:MAG: FAD-dependent 5-carboxymethylaminomethyl-2-thiouridine(34) oxidoreductase MnmC [Proteobacteria bacterium]|nr:FAD-dependent 5-carboxymethylaminomethyl-2-thiouridine(34) oxidoreductase MnmC [Pseudomonadota bacterium]
MKTEPITPARIDWSGEAPRALDFDDIYHPRIGALAQAGHVFLRGNALPARWRGRARFTILETGFGLGLNFLATWAAWRGDGERCERLHFVSVEKHPPTRADLQRAHAGLPLADLAQALQALWPPLTPNLHLLEFEGGRVQLLLAFGDIARWLPALRLQADACFLDGFAPERNAAMWAPSVFEALRRHAAPDATAATWSAARSVRDGLARAGFAVERAAGVGGKREISVARYVPRAGRRTPPDLRVPHAERKALVVGAGVAGAFTAAALHADGWDVSVVDRRGDAAGDVPGNLGGLFHGSVHVDDGPHARLLRSAALLAARVYAPAVATGRVRGQTRGLLQVERRLGRFEALQALAARCGLPAEYVQPLAASEAARHAGVPIDAPAWFFPGGGWVAPGDLVGHALQGTRRIGNTAIARIERRGTRWRLWDERGHVVDEAPLVVVCAAEASTRLLGPWLAPSGGLDWPGWPIERSRGQVSVLGATTPLALPLVGDGYALPLADGRLLCGATRHDGDDDDAVRAHDHRFNAERARRLTGLDLPLAPEAWQGRVGWRLTAIDRQPIAGPVVAPTLGSTLGSIEHPGMEPQIGSGVAPAVGWQARERSVPLHRLAREPGLFVVTALGSRGLTLAPLLGRLVAAMAGGSPWPLERDLVAAIDAGRWLGRAAPKRRHTGELPGLR